MTTEEMLNNLKESYKEKLDYYKSKNSDLSKENEILENQVKDLKSEIKELQVKNEDLELQVKWAKDKNKSLKNLMVADLKKILNELDTVGFLNGAGSKKRGIELIKDTIVKYDRKSSK